MPHLLNQNKLYITLYKQVKFSQKKSFDFLSTDALASTIAALEAKGFAVPNSSGVASGKFFAHVPKTTQAQLATRAKAEGVSLNALVLTFIAGGLGRQEHHA